MSRFCAIINTWNKRSLNTLQFEIIIQKVRFPSYSSFSFGNNLNQGSKACKMHFLCEQCKHLLGGNRNFPCQCGEYYLTSYIFKVSHNSYPCMHHFQYIPAPKHSERSIIYFMFLILWKFLLFRTTFNFPIFERWKLKSWVKSHFGKICTSKFLQVPLHEGRCRTGIGNYNN